MQKSRSRVIFVTGASGSGKSTIGPALAKCLGYDFLDADDLHTPTIIGKLKKGRLPSDDNRLEWLAAVVDAVKERHAKGENLVVDCCAITRRYRQILRESVPNADSWLIFLSAPREVLRTRVTNRPGHILNPANNPGLFDLLVDGLEMPTKEEEVLTLDTSNDEVERAVSYLASL